jgi:LysM repeat protein
MKANRLPVFFLLLALACGCSGGPAAGPDATGEKRPEAPAAPAPANPPGARVHVVMPGDSLFKIAKDHYGNGTYWEHIVQANQGTLIPSDMKPGQKIVIPVISGVPFQPLKPSLPGPSTEASTPDPGAKDDYGEELLNEMIRRLSSPPRLYTVKPGDTLGSIAKLHYGDESLWHGISWANDDLGPDQLRAGMQLIIPEAAPDAFLEPPFGRPEIADIDFLTRHIDRHAAELHGEEVRDFRTVLLKDLDDDKQPEIVVVYAIGPSMHNYALDFLAVFKRFDTDALSLIHKSYIGSRGWRHIGKVEAGKDCVTIHGMEFQGGEAMSSPSLSVRLVVTMKERAIRVDRQVDTKE